MRGLREARYRDVSIEILEELESGSGTQWGKTLDLNLGLEKQWWNFLLLLFLKSAPFH